jgi:hypothetical protein
VQDLFSSLAKKELPIPGQYEEEKRVQRCLGEWSCSFCNGQKSNKDLTTNDKYGMSGLNRESWDDDEMVYEANDSEIRALLAKIYDHYRWKLYRYYGSRDDFIDTRLPIIKARVNMSCEITKKFVDWNKYQVSKKFIRYAIEKWIDADKPKGTGKEHMLQQLLMLFLNSPEYNPLRIKKLSDPKLSFLDNEAMYFNSPKDPYHQSINRTIGIHPTTIEKTHGWKLMYRLDIDIDKFIGGRYVKRTVRISRRGRYMKRTLRISRLRNKRKTRAKRVLLNRAH